MAVPTITPPASTPTFLARAGWAGATVLPLAGDASFRRYFRVIDTSEARRAVLMDAPAPHENPQPFLDVAGYLTSHGFRAPTILATDLDAGLVLIEDFGDRLMRAEVDGDPALEFRIYGDCIDLIAHLSTCAPADLSAYDLAHYLREVHLLAEWTVPALGLSVDLAAYDAAWTAVLAPVLADPRRVTVLRDYHSENVMLLHDEGGAARLGLLDFQDALVGHPAYDLVSLLQDARRDVSPELEAAMLDRYCAATGQGSDFRAHYAILGAQRNAKIIGIFTRLARRDGKHRYLSMIPRMWALLERDLAHPALVPVRDWFAGNMPPKLRDVALPVAQ